ncbi:MAG: UDP-glucose/GDP-mannose dehydrogenase family protein [Armatimonadetes bacterium]|nr:UDP-glucose/GDP-mannose dehydrogenase family protein [Armatimonadota bacterium]
MIGVIGLGFVGLTTALGFSAKGYKVYGFDLDMEKLRLLRSGKIYFYEPYLENILKENINKNFYPVSSIKDFINDVKIIFFCVGTPALSDGGADLKYILKALEDTLKEMKRADFKVLVIKSTIPPSSAKERIKPFIEELGFNAGVDVGIANNPEFLREGYAWEDFIHPDRIVVGYEDEKSILILEELYKPFNAPLFKVSLNTAEFIKYLSNTLLAAMISFSNEMSMVADAIGDIDISNAFKILHNDKRWRGTPANMTSYVYPGCGFGGYCLPKDTEALYFQSKFNGYEPMLIKEVLKVNSKIKEFVVNKITNTLCRDDYIGILGLSFKPNSDDVRETPSKDIIKMFLERGFKKIIAYDRIAQEKFKEAYKLPIEYGGNIKEVADKADNILILTAWDEFKKDKNLLINKNVFDFRYFW